MAVVGGSIGGLTAGLLLRDLGCDVRIYERSGSELDARGAGIAVLDATIRYFRERTAVEPDTFCSRTGWNPLSVARRVVPLSRPSTRTGSPRGTRSTGNCCACSTPSATTSRVR